MGKLNRSTLIAIVLAIAIPVWESIKGIIIAPLISISEKVLTDTFEEKASRFQATSGIEDHKIENRRFFFLYDTPYVPDCYYYVTLEVNGVPYLDEDGNVWRMPKSGLWDTSNLQREKYRTKPWWGGYGFSMDQMKVGDEIAVKWHLFELRTSNDDKIVKHYYRIEDKK